MVYPIAAENAKVIRRNICVERRNLLSRNIAARESETGIWCIATPKRTAYPTVSESHIPARIPSPSKRVWIKIATNDTSAT